VLITDGVETCHRDPADEAGKLKLALGVNVVGFGLNDEERKAVRGIADAGKGKYYDAEGAAALSKELAVVGKVVAAAAKVELGGVVAIGATTVDAPEMLPLGVTGKVTLGVKESAYVMVMLPAGESAIVLDARREEATRIDASVSILDEDGGEMARDFVTIDEWDHAFRSARNFAPKKATKYILRLTNNRPKADFWLTVAPTDVFVPLFGDTLPTKLQPGLDIKGELAAGGSAYYAVRLPKGEYKAVVGFDHAKGENGRLEGYLATLNTIGGNQQTFVPIDEYDVRARKSGVLTLKESATVVLRVKTTKSPVKYALKFRPASE